MDLPFELSSVLGSAMQFFQDLRRRGEGFRVWGYP